MQDWMVLTVLPVSPPHVRPAIMTDGGSRGEDDITFKLVTSPQPSICRCATHARERAHTHTFTHTHTHTSASRTLHAFPLDALPRSLLPSCPSLFSKPSFPLHAFPRDPLPLSLALLFVPYCSSVSPPQLPFLSPYVPLMNLPSPLTVALSLSLSLSLSRSLALSCMCPLPLPLQCRRCARFCVCVWCSSVLCVCLCCV